MAEAVRSRLEQRTNELHNLLELGIFDEKEIKNIVKKREQFEYRLRRRVTRREDFLAYIQYETSLEKLRKLRKRRLGIQISGHLSDFSIVDSLHTLYYQALVKFKDDLNFWKKYFTFCKQHNSPKRLSKAYAQCLRFHSDQPEVWLEAADWELHNNNNAKNARILLQRGLRANKTSKELYLAYFRLELEYWHKMVQRAHILGIDLAMLEERERNALAEIQKQQKQNPKADMNDSDTSDGSDHGIKPTVAIRKRKKRKNDVLAQLNRSSDDDDDWFSQEEDRHSASKRNSSELSRGRNRNQPSSTREISGDSDNDDIEGNQSQSDNDDEFDAELEARDAKDLLSSISQGNEQEENSGPSPEDQPFSSEGEKALEQARAVGVSFYSGVIPRVIYFTAIGYHPQDIQFQKKFLDIYRCFENTDSSRSQIYEQLPVDNTDALVLICRRPLDDHHIDAVFMPEQKLEALNLSDSLFERAISQLELSSLKTHHLMVLREAVESFGNDDDELAKRARSLLNKRCDEYAFSKVAPCVTAVEFLLTAAQEQGNNNIAHKLLDRALQHDELRTSSILWELKVNMVSIADGNVAQVLLDAANSLEPDHAQKFLAASWQLHAERNDSDGMQETIRIAVSRNCPNKQSLCCLHVEWLGKRAFLEPLRTHLYLTWVAVEIEHKTSPAIIRTIFEEAISKYGKISPRLWARFIEFEQQEGRHKESSQLRWRAYKTLEDPAALADHLNVTTH
eukprot:gene318-3687_t